jgi:hypothetical protein
LIETEAELLGYDKRWCWYRIPKPGASSHVILTMPRDFLPHGLAKARFVLLQYDEKSFRHTDTGFVVEGKILKEIRKDEDAS